MIEKPYHLKVIMIILTTVTTSHLSGISLNSFLKVIIDHLYLKYWLFLIKLIGLGLGDNDGDAELMILLNSILWSLKPIKGGEQQHAAGDDKSTDYDHDSKNILILF